MTQTQVSGSGIKNNVITNSHLHSAANISGSKLADSGVTAGSYGSGSATLSLTINAQGLITAASTNSITQVGGSNGVDFNDNVRARFGTGDDLEIYHNGTQSFIKNATGNLDIITGSTSIDLQGNDGSETLAKFQPNGSVELYYDNSAKLSTINDGIDVDGSITCNDLITAGAVLHEGDTNTLMHFDSNDNIAFKTDGTVRFRVNSGQITASRHLKPDANNTYDLGSSSERWKNIYTNDLNLSNEGSSNDMDGTWGNWTIQEGESDLFLKNNRSGKKYKFNLMEVS